MKKTPVRAKRDAVRKAAQQPTVKRTRARKAASSPKRPKRTRDDSTVAVNQARPATRVERNTPRRSRTGGVFKKPVDPKRSAAAKKGWRTRKRKALLSNEDRRAKSFVQQRERELRDIERRPYVKKITNNLKQINHVKNLFFRRMKRVGFKPDDIWNIYYAR